jgi:hypothetical protein
MFSAACTTPWPHTSAATPATSFPSVRAALQRAYEFNGV